jgi:hypothetical protein
MKSIKQQYIDLREGRMSQANFMRNLRMTMPQYITNITSFNDSVKILKNKGILSEMLDPTQAEEIAKTAGSYKAAVDKLMDMGLSSQEADKIANEMYGEEDVSKEEIPGDDEYMDYEIWWVREDRFNESKSLNEAKDEKTKWTNTSGKSMYDQFSEINNLNAQEVLVGIDYEREKNPELTKAAAAKIVVKNLKKNPIYYTASLMSGIEGYEAEYIGGKSAQPEAHQMQYLDKNMGNVVDKKRGMQPVKGIEKAKKDSDKGGETNKAVKGIELMSLIAKTVRGMKKMDATGEKMKKIAMKESFESWLSDKRGEEMRAAAASEVHNGLKIGDNVKVNSEAARALDIDPKDVYKIQSFRKIKPGSLMQSVDATIANDQGNTFTINIEYLYEAGKVANTIFNRNANITAGLKSLTKDDLMEMIREELREMADGYEPLSREDGSSYVVNEVDIYGIAGNPEEEMAARMARRPIDKYEPLSITKADRDRDLDAMLEDAVYDMDSLVRQVGNDVKLGIALISRARVTNPSIVPGLRQALNLYNK